MLIIGATELNLPKGRGQFFCPFCRADAEYRHKLRRNFLTLYFIPIVPLQKVNEFVLCQRCGQKFGPDAITRDRVEVLDALRDASLQHIYRAMVLTMISDHESSDAEVNVIRRYMEQIGGGEFSASQVLLDAEMATQAMTTAAEYVGRIADELDEHEIEELVVGAFLTASATGPPSAAQMDDLRLLPMALGMNESRFREVIAMASEVDV